MSFRSSRLRSFPPARANASRLDVIRPMRVASSYIICTVSRCSGFRSSSSSVCANPEMMAAGLLIWCATPLTSCPMAPSFSACWSCASVRFWSVTARASARMRVVRLPSRTGAYSNDVMPCVPFERDDGTHGITSLLYAPVREGNRITRILALARDVTDQKRTEAQLQQAEKLGAMGQLVSGVAHEINNPAAIISGFAQTLLLDDLKPEHREMLQMIYDEATRIGRITSNLLAFARAGGSQRTLVDLNDIARRTFALRSYHLSTLNITVSLALDATEPKIWADASELQQMLLNLLINAEQALVTVDGPRTVT